MVLNFSFPNRPYDRLNPKESKDLQRQVLELLEKDYICESMSSYVVPTLLLPKKDDWWHMYVDSSVINRITIKYKFSLPFLDDMLDQLSCSMVFS